MSHLAIPRLHIRVTDDTCGQVLDEQIIEPNCTVRVIERKIVMTRNDPNLHDCLIVPLVEPVYLVRLKSQLNIRSLTKRRMELIGVYSAGLIATDRGVFYSLKPPSRGYMNVKERIGMSFDFVDTQGVRVPDDLLDW